MTTGKRTVLIITLVVTIVVALVIAGRYVVFKIIEKRIQKALATLEEDGIFIRVDSLGTDPWAKSITLKGVHGFVAHHNLPKDSIRTSTINEITIDAIELLPLIFDHQLSIGSVVIDRPILSWPEKFSVKKKPDSKEPTLRGITIRRLAVSRSCIELTDSLDHESRKLGFKTFEAGGIVLENRISGSDWRFSTSSSDSITIHLAKDFYTIRIDRTTFNANDKTMRIDSIRVLPDYNKQVFARKSIRQIDRIEGIIPSIQFRGVSVSKKGNLSLEASQVSLDFNIHVFRDKRYPFHNNTKTLPVRFLRSLPVSIQIDTVSLGNSYVRYEEFQEAGDSAGYIYFNKLTALIHNLSNLSGKETIMDAEADFMDAGRLQVHFTFPTDPDKEYRVHGTLKNFSLPKINSMLVPAAKARVQSGTLEEMKFHFIYNDTRADGEVTLNYTDLKMASSKKSNVARKIITFLLNTFIRNDMDRNTAADKKTGTILFYRDHRRAIFNYWWKSLLSGIKSVYNLDKITNTHSNRKEGVKSKS